MSRWILYVIVLGLAPTYLLAGVQTASLRNPEGAATIEIAPSIPYRTVTGRLVLVLSKTNDPEVRLQASYVPSSVAIFGVNVNAGKRGARITVGGKTKGFPWARLDEIPPGDYYIQALLNVFTRCSRADGHTVWVHLDRWEGQQFSVSPGNLFSAVQKVHLDRAHPLAVELSLDHIVPPLQEPSDTAWVRHIKFQSKLLSAFWGCPMYLGAVVLLPRGYDTEPRRFYPAIYVQDHFSSEPPFRFAPDDRPITPDDLETRERFGVESGHEFYEAWSSDDFPRLVVVRLLHPTPYYDDSYSVNSANNGPYGDAILTELIPRVEQEFRLVQASYARALTGSSTGGWESLALQLYHPDVFGGAWIISPDPIDFSRYGLVDIYHDKSAFKYDPISPPFGYSTALPDNERPFFRTTEGQPIITIRQLSQLEGALDEHGRSGGIYSNWEAVFGPTDSSGYPTPLWDKQTGEIDQSVATYMRDHGYDLRAYAQTHWPELGPKLLGKLHFYCGDSDNAYLNLAVYQFESFLNQTANPHYTGYFEYGRPLKGHSWRPMTNASLVRMISNEMEKQRLNGESRGVAGN
jgi:Putative esterase